MVHLVTAVIKPHRLEAVVDALQDTNVRGSPLLRYVVLGDRVATPRPTVALNTMSISFPKFELKSW